MEVRGFLSGLLDFNWNVVERALDGLAPDEFTRRPTSETNSIAWLMWHTARDEDYLISLAQKQPQLWVREKWHEKFNMKPGSVEHDFKDIGVGQSAEEAGSFDVDDASLLIGYYLETRQNTEDYLKTLTPSDLDKEMPDPWGPGATRLVDYFYCILDEALAHGGQIAYLRGLYRGMGWDE